jgi:serine protease Do
MTINFTKPRLFAIAATAFVAGVFFASSMDWTTLLRAQAKTGGKALATATQPLADQQNAFVAIAEHVTPAVVSISAERDVRPADTRTRGRAQQLPPGFEQFFDQQDDPRRGPQQSTGSGFIVSSDGYVLTNNHVVENMDRVKVSLTDRRTFKAKIVGRDPQTDVAVLKIDGKDLPTVALGDDNKTRIGEWAVAIGNPLGLDFTVTAGIISAKGRSQELAGLNSDQYRIQDFIQTDAAINPGNSGGPLVNIRGEVVGINSAIASQTGFYSGYGFAIPITLAKTVMDDIIAHGRVRRAIMGVSLQEVTAEDAAVNNLKEIAGAKVVNFGTVENGPGEKAGLELGDIIVKADGKPIDRVSTLQRQVRMHQPGETVELEAVRYGKKESFKVKLIEAPEEKAIASAAAVTPKNDADAGATAVGKRLGLTVESITPAVRTAAILPDDQQGVVVKAIDPAGPAASKLLIEDVITGTVFPEKSDVRTMADLQKVIGKLKDGDIVGLRLSRRIDQKGTRQPSIVNLRIGG